MKRQEAEKLLAALIFDDLDETSKADLQAYLQTDDELRERLTDMRMAVKVASDTLSYGPEPTLSDRRLKRLAKLARHQQRGPRIFTLGRLAVAAAVFIVAALVFVPTLQRSRLRRLSSSNAPQTEPPAAEYYRVLSDGSPTPDEIEAAEELARRIKDDADKLASLEGLSEESRRTELSAVVARSTSNSRPVADDVSAGVVNGYIDEITGREVARYRAGTYAPPVGQVADAKKPAPVTEPESVVASDVENRDSRGMFMRSLRGTGGGPAGPAPVPADGATVPSLQNSLVIAAEPVAEGKPAVSSTDSPATATHNSTRAYEFRGNIQALGGPAVAGQDATSQVSSFTYDRNERGEELAWSFESEPSDRETSTYGLYSYADSRGDRSQPGAESKSKRSSSRTDILNVGKPVDRLAAGSGPESDVEQSMEGLKKELSAVSTKLQEAAEKYNADPALPEGARFKVVPVNPWVMTDRDALSTFALDVDTASYTLCRRYIQNGYLPPIGAVRMEEFINYFDYQYPQRSAPTFAVHAEAAPSPFAGRDKNLTLLKVGVKARTLGRDQQRPAHLIFVIDASASMGQADRLPLVQEALGLLVDKLSPADRVSLITCADQGRLHLETMPATQRDTIGQRIEAIQPAGPTNLLAGLKLGYALAKKAFVPNQINHVVLCSDGVANVGQTEAESVLQAVAEDRKQGITLTCIGVGYGTYNDVFLEALANQGDGSYLFLDSPKQARETFVDKFSAALQVVAKDARIQVSFNPRRVRRYRLIGYENRDIEDARFRDDTVDAGEVGSGQRSTALYELELIGQPSTDGAGDLGTVYVRYRDVETGQVQEISSRLTDAIVGRPTVEDNPRFFLAAAAARFAEWLRQSEHAQEADIAEVLATVEQISLTLPLDRDVRELAELIRKAQHLPRAP